MPEIIVKLGDNIVQKYFFVKESMSVGRTADNQIVIENLAVSRNHARIDYDGELYTIEDLDSANGTFVNGVRVTKTEVLDRDVISIGKHKLYFYNQHACDGVRRPALDSGDSTMLMNMTPTPQLTVTKGRQKGQCFDLSRMPCPIGRGSSNAVRINDWFVSKQHALIEKREDQYVIRDLDSWRNTKINGTIINEAVLKPGDEIQLGPTVLMVFAYAESGLEPDPSLRHPVEMQPGQDPAAVELTEEALETSDTAASETPGVRDEPWSNGFHDRPAHGSDFDEAILEEALGNGARKTNGTAPTDESPMDFENWPYHSEEREPAVEQFMQAAIELEEGTALWENACPEERNLESFTELESDDGHEGEDSQQPCEPVTANVAATPDDTLANEIAMWEKALDNKSPLIRKQAVRRLKKLTGRDYDN